MKNNKIKKTNTQKKKNDKNHNKKDNQDEEIFIPRLELGIYSETISKLIIEKIISLTMTEIYRKRIEKELSNHCYSSIKSILNNISKTYFITYDEDDYNIEKEIHFEEISISNEIITNIHTSNLTTERNLNSLIETNNNFNNNKKAINDFFEKEKNFWGYITQPKSCLIDRSSIYKNNFIKFEIIEESNIIEEDETPKSYKRNVFKKNSLHKFTNNEIITGNEPKKKKGYHNFSFHQIDYNKIRSPKQVEQDKYFDSLRKEYELMIVKLNENNLKKENEEKLKEINNQKIENFKNQIKNKKITVDSNGDIVYVKEIPIENLKKEFFSLNSDTKELKQIKSNIKYKEFNEKIPVEKNKNQNRFDFKMFDKEKENEKKKEKEKEKNKDNDKEKDKEKEKNRNSKGLRIFQSKILRSLNDFIFNDMNKKVGQKIIISGSNFNQINPEIGVNIIENEKIKTGGRDFFSKYNKYSLEKYNSLSKFIEEDNRQEFLKKNEEKSFLNPLIKKRNSSMKDLKSRNLTINKNNNNNILNNTNSTNNILKNSINTFNNTIEKEKFSNFIKTNINTPLKNMIENANLINEEEYYRKKPHFSNINFFKEKYKKSSDQKDFYDLNGIDNFNKTLVTKTELNSYPQKKKNEIIPIIPKYKNFKNKEKNYMNTQRIRIFLPSYINFQDQKLMKSSSSKYFHRKNLINKKTFFPNGKQLSKNLSSQNFLNEKSP